MKRYIKHIGVCASGTNISCTRIWKGTMQLWFHSLTDGDSTSGLYAFKHKARPHCGIHQASTTLELDTSLTEHGTQHEPSHCIDDTHLEPKASVWGVFLTA